jgi:hypothetical protein
MVGLLAPLFKATGQLRKLILTPLARYWLKPCCDNPDHHTNYSSSSYLPCLGSNVFKLREFIRDSLFTRRTGNFRVICPNRMLGLGPMLDDDKANEISELWGRDAVHPRRLPMKLLHLLWTKTFPMRERTISTRPNSPQVPPTRNRESTTASCVRTGSMGALRHCPGATPIAARVTRTAILHAAKAAVTEGVSSDPSSGTSPGVATLAGADGGGGGGRGK